MAQFKKLFLFPPFVLISLKAHSAILIEPGSADLRGGASHSDRARTRMQRRPGTGIQTDRRAAGTEPIWLPWMAQEKWEGRTCPPGSLASCLQPQACQFSRQEGMEHKDHGLGTGVQVESLADNDGERGVSREPCRFPGRR